MSFNYPCSKLWFFCKKRGIENSITYIYTKWTNIRETPEGLKDKRRMMALNLYKRRPTANTFTYLRAYGNLTKEENPNPFV